MTKTVTKKQLLAAACTSDQEKLIKKYWPFGRKGMSLDWVIYRAEGLSVPFHTIGALIQILDPRNWVAVVRGPSQRIDYKASVERYLEREEYRMLGFDPPPPSSEFISKYWWDQPFAKGLIRRGLRPGYHFVSSADYARLHDRTWQGRAEEYKQTITAGNQQAHYGPWYPYGNLEDELKVKEKTVTKMFTKKQLLDAICDDRYTKVIEMFWPPGEKELAIRQIVTIARAIPNVPLYAVGDIQIKQLIHRLDAEGWMTSGGLAPETIHFGATQKIDRYLKWDEERVLEEVRPIIEEAMKRPETRAPGNFQGVRMAPAPDALLSELEEFSFPKWPGNLRLGPADMTLKETVALIEKYRSSSDFYYPRIEVYGDGSGSLRGDNEEKMFGFSSIEELEKKLRKLIAPAVVDYTHLFYVKGGVLCADFSSVEITDENCLPMSLAKWKVNRAESAKAGRSIENGGRMTCACCQIYNPRRGEGCKGCPIDKATDGDGCVGTPYQEYNRAHSEGDLGGALVANIREEQFLEGLIARRGLLT